VVAEASGLVIAVCAYAGSSATGFQFPDLPDSAQTQQQSLALDQTQRQEFEQ
jgi:hypothetical protein